MYNKVVVPLDGSKLAEQALSHLEKIAQDRPEIMLVSVTEKIMGQVTEKQLFESSVSKSELGLHPPHSGAWQAGVASTGVDAETSIDLGIHKIQVTLGKMKETAEKYLQRIAEKLEEQGFKVTMKVLVGNPAKEIVSFAEEQKADLIIMASTGKPKINRWDMSSIAAKVIRETRVPVTLVKPGRDFKETRPRRKGVAS